MADPKPKSLPIVLVHWIDAETSATGWQGRKEVAAMTPGLAYTAGFLLREDETAVVVALSYDHVNDHANGAITIPRKWVKGIRRLGAWRASG